MVFVFKYENDIYIYFFYYFFPVLLILLCLTACVGALYLLFDPIIQHVILGRLVLRNDTEFAEIWAEPPITPHLKLYYFNLTNAERFFAGEEGPKVEEVGPYVYL